MAAKRRAADVPRLAACFENGSTPMLKRWFAQLLDFKPDPRLPTAAVDSAVRYHSTGDATPRMLIERHAAEGGDADDAYRALFLALSCELVRAIET